MINEWVVYYYQMFMYYMVFAAWGLQVAIYATVTFNIGYVLFGGEVKNQEEVVCQLNCSVR